MTGLWIASSNAGKRNELRSLLARAGLALEPRLLSELSPAPVIVEDGATLEENADRKAIAVARAARGHALGDDSGLCVDALGGRPGVRSARWAGEGASDGDRIAKLLRELDGVPDAGRGASFVCCLSLAGPDGEVLLRVEGRCRGTILHAPRGTRGFGYDPVFLHPESGRTFAELDEAEKNRVSHRGVALARLVALMGRIGAFAEGSGKA
jgi:XTP/dITP diphosphohydrolase